MNVVLLGPPGAGKGTQGELLARSQGWVRLSTGDLLREAVRQGTSLGAEARRYMDAGELVPDEVILGMVREVLERPAAGYVFDGFPRTRPQAEALDGLLADLRRGIDAAVVVDVPDDVLVKRVSGRRSCGSCGAVYNIYYNPPATADVCDRCGNALVERADDSEATVRRRLDVYREQTEPLIDYYEKNGAPVAYVDGNRPVEAVQHSVRETLGL
ncbi:MAG: adenylate kinase [Longimicrobiales bacterium]